MKEKSLYPKLSQIVSKNCQFFGSSAFELKVAHKDKYYLKQLEPHQLRALRMVRLNGVYHKISDESRVSKPFDSFLLKGNAYVVIYFDTSRKFYFIPIDSYTKITSPVIDEAICESIAFLKS
jgi:penicillin-binding protein-related factor A (putative recombinase)